MRYFLRLIVISGIFAGFMSPIFSAAADAARVAIIKYTDRTGTKNFEYMPSSLQLAITKSMHQKFEFNEVNAAKVEPIAAEIRAKNKGEINAKNAAEICRRADIDILIYGNFTFNQATNAIEIHTDISLGSTDKYRNLQPVNNRVDATIFGAAEKVAGNIVTEITKVAQDQQKQKGEAAAKDKKGKTQLGKTEKDKTWADTNWMISLFGGPSIPLVSQANATVKVDGMLGLQAFRRIKGGWHAGFFGSWGGLRTQGSTGAKAEMEVVASALTGGYFWDLSPRWRATTFIGAGYYYGSFNRYTDCGGSSCSGSSSEKFIIKNPFAVAGGGIHFMIFSFLSVGLEANYRLHYDSPKPVHGVAGNLVISGMF